MPFECEQCGREFESEHGMKVHEAQAHQGQQEIDPEDIPDIEGIKTGIDGFDALMTKGVPRGSSILVEGGPGSGKTIFCLQTAFKACERGDKVLYMSFEEPVHRLMHHMTEFGWDIKPHLEENRLRINRYNALDIARSVEALLSEAKRELLIEVKPMLFPEEFEPDIVLFDSLTSIASAFAGEESRFRIYMEQLFKYLEQEDITSFLIRETPNPTHIGQQAGGAGEAVSFLSDGIFVMYNAVHPSGSRDRATEIVKLRGEDFQSGIVQFDIKGDGGIHVYPDTPLEGDYTLT